MNISEIMFTKTASLQCTGTLQHLLNESATEAKYLFKYVIVNRTIKHKKKKKVIKHLIRLSLNKNRLLKIIVFIAFCIMC